MTVIGDMANVYCNRWSNVYPTVRWFKSKYDCIYNFPIELDPITYDYVDDFKIKKRIGGGEGGIERDALDEGVEEEVGGRGMGKELLGMTKKWNS